MRRTLTTGLRHAALLVSAAAFLAPVAFLVVGSFKPEGRILADAGSWRAFFPAHWTLDNYRDVFARVDFVRFLLNSLLINGAMVLSGLAVNSLAAYALARLRWAGRPFVLGLVLATLVVPFEAIAVPLFYGLSAIGWRDDWSVQVVPFVANPLSIWLFYVFFAGLPRELEEAARVDGAGVLRTFLTVVVPNARAAFATVAIVTLLFYWGMYLWPLLMTAGPHARPLPLAIATFYTLPPLRWGDILAFGTLMVAPVLLLFILFQRAFVRGVAATGIKG